MRKHYLALVAAITITAITAACGGHHDVLPPQPQSDTGGTAIGDMPLTTSDAVVSASAVQVTQLTLPDNATGGITVGANGAVYINGYRGYMRYSGGVFTRYNYPVPTGAVRVGGVDGQNTITAGPGGTIWSTLYRGPCCPTAGALVGALTTSTGAIAESAGGTLTGESFDTLAPDGLNHMWVIHHTGTVCSNAQYNILIFDSAFRVLSRITLPTTARLNAMTRGPDGMMYVATALSCDTGTPQIFRINPTTRAILRTTTLPSGSYIKELTAGPDGAVWFTNYTKNSIGRLSSTGTVTNYALPVTFSLPTGITLGSDGALWFTEEIAPANMFKVGRITTAGAITEYALPHQGPYLMASEITGGTPGGARLSHTLYVIPRGFHVLLKLTF